jgi:hypothetical protein
MFVKSEYQTVKIILMILPILKGLKDYVKYIVVKK